MVSGKIVFLNSFNCFSIGFMDDIGKSGTPLNISTLNEVVLCLDGSSNTISADEANQLLIRFLEREDAASFSFNIIASNSAVLTKYIGLEALIKKVQRSWLVLSKEEKHDIRCFAYAFLISTDTSINRQLISKATTLLLEILKFEWPNQWPEFLDSLFATAKSSNAYVKSKLLMIIDAIIDVIVSKEFSRPEIQQNMEIALSKQLEPLLGFLDDLINSESSEETILKVLNVFQILLQWIPSQIFISSSFFKKLIYDLIHNPTFSVAVFSLLSSFIFINNLRAEEIAEPTYNIYQMLTSSLQIFETNPKLVNQQFFDSFELIHNTIFSNFLFLFNPDSPTYLSMKDSLTSCLSFFMILTNKVADTTNEDSWIFNPNIEPEECLQCCIHFWSLIFGFCKGSFSFQKINYFDDKTNFLSKLLLDICSPFWETLLRIIVAKIPSPYASIVSIDEFSQEHHQIDSTILGPFSEFKSCVRILHRNFSQAVFEKLEEILDEISQGASSDSVVHFCWTLACFSDILCKDDYFPFLTKLISTLFQICDSYEKIESRSNSIGSVIYFLVNVNPFLVKNIKLFQAIVMTILELLTTGDESLQDLLLFNLKTLSYRQPLAFTISQDSTNQSFLSVIENNIPNLISKLKNYNLFKFYQTICNIISGDHLQRLNPVDHVSILVQAINPIFTEVLSNFEPSNIECLKSLLLFLKCHSAITIAIKEEYYKPFFKEIYPEINKFFIMISDFISSLTEKSSLNEAGRENIDVGKAVINNIINLLYNYAFNTKEPIPEITDSSAMIYNQYITINPFLRVSGSIHFFIIIFLKHPELIPINPLEYFHTIVDTTRNMIDELSLDDFSSYLQQFLNAFVSRLPKFKNYFLNPDEIRYFANQIEELCNNFSMDVVNSSFNTYNNFICTVSQYLPSGETGFYEEVGIHVLLFTFKRILTISDIMTFKTISHFIMTLSSFKSMKTLIPTFLIQFAKEFPNLDPSFIEELGKLMISDESKEKPYLTILVCFKDQVNLLLPMDRELKSIKEEQIWNNFVNELKQIQESEVVSQNSPEKKELATNIASINISNE